MKRALLLAAVALACGDSAWPPENCDPPLPATDDDGRPWPTYTEMAASLSDCEDDGITRRRGACDDGRLFLEQSGPFTGDTYYYDGEVLVGLRRYSDIASACSEYRFGDASCEEAGVEPIVCR
jgi:hypothetical protein